MKAPALITVLLTTLFFTTLATAGDVPRLIDEDGPANGTRALDLEELWRVGGEDGDMIFGRIVDVDMRPDGTVHVLDNQLCRVAVFSPDGEYVGDISREGEGPGEISQPTGLVLMPDGVVGIAQGFPGEVIRLDANGDPLPSLYPIGRPADGNIGLMIGLDYADGVLVACGGRMVFTGPDDSYVDRFLAVTDDAGAEAHRVLEHTIPIDPTSRNYSESEAYYIDYHWTVGTGGELYAAMNRDAYEVSVFDTAGNLKRVFGRQCSPRKRTRDEMDEITPLININGNAPRDEWTIAEHDPCIDRIQYDAERGQVWVRSSDTDDDLPDGVLEIWDVFDKHGAYIERVEIPLGHEMNDGALYLVGNGRVVIVRGAGSSFDGDEAGEADEELEPLEVVCYKTH